MYMYTCFYLYHTILNMMTTIIIHRTITLIMINMKISMKITRTLGKTIALLLSIGIVLLPYQIQAEDYFSPAPDVTRRILNLGVEGTLIYPYDRYQWTYGSAIRMSFIHAIGDQVVAEIPRTWVGPYVRGNYNGQAQAWDGIVGLGAGFYFLAGELGLAKHHNTSNWVSGVETTAILTMGYAGIFIRRNWNWEQTATTEFGLRLTLPIIPFLYPFVYK